MAELAVEGSNRPNWNSTRGDMTLISPPLSGPLVKYLSKESDVEAAKVSDWLEMKFFSQTDLPHRIQCRQ